MLTEDVFNFINLTTGLDWIKRLGNCFYGFSRFQSTLLEQGLYEQFLNEVDNNILMLLALGKHVNIWDMTSSKRKGKNSRACWQGISWLDYVLNRIWLHKENNYKYGMQECFKKKFDLLSISFNSTISTCHQFSNKT